MLMYPSIIFSSKKTKNIADIEISNVVNPNCSWLPFYRPCSFASYPFEYFAKIYIFLSYSDKRRMSICFHKSATRCSIFWAPVLYVTGRLSPPRAMPLFIIPESPQPLQNRPRPDTQFHLRRHHPSESRTHPRHPRYNPHPDRVSAQRPFSFSSAS